MQKCTAALRPLMETYALATSTIGNTYWATELKIGSGGGTRTPDRTINSRVLYQLSYT